MPLLTQRLDTDLGCWAHTEWRPAPDDPLAWAIERVWDFDGMVAAPHERVFPNGMVELILQLDDRYSDVHPHGLVATPQLCITGVWSRSMVIRAPRQPCRVLAVRMQPPGAWSILAHPLDELAEKTADLSLLLGHDVALLAEKCHAAPSGVERVSLAVSWLRGLFQRGSPAGRVHPAVRWVARSVGAGGHIPIAALRAEAGVSDERLVSLFRQQVGVTPKRYARIRRFDRAIALLSRPGASLSDVALSAGYYDQPHMNAEFRQMAGMSPRAFLTSRRFPNSPSLPESA